MINITDVRITKVEGDEKLRGFAALVIDDCFVVGDLRVLEGEDGNTVDGQPLGPVLGRLMARARLRSFQNRIFEQLDTISMTLLPRP